MGEERTTRVWIVGAGAIGSVVAGKLRPHCSCAIFDAWSDHVDAIRESGLSIGYPEGSTQVFPQAYLEEEIGASQGKPDVILLAVKAHRTAECVNRLLPHMADDTAIVSLQNGVNEELIMGLVGRERTVGAVVDFAAEVLGPGRVRGHGLDYGIIVGELDGSITPRLARLAELIDPTIPVEPTDDIWGALWSKLIANVQVNALCALTRLPTDELAADRMLRRLSLSLAMEAVEIATRLSITLNPAFLDGPLDAYLNRAGDEDAMRGLERGFLDRWSGESFRPSMLQDVEKGRPTEIDALNGYVVEKAYEVGVHAPVNEAIVELVKRPSGGADWGYDMCRAVLTQHATSWPRPGE